VVVAVLAPDGVAVVAAFMWTLEGIVDAGDGEEEPGEGGADFVGKDGVAGAVGAAREGVYWGGLARWKILKLKRKGRIEEVRGFREVRKAKTYWSAGRDGHCLPHRLIPA
jgi:hypothetical protein